MNDSRIQPVCLALLPLLLLLLLLQAGCAAPAPTAAVQREHYDPAYLNEAAAAALSSGDGGTALILLERAAVLSPWNETIRSNLATLRRAGASTMAVDAAGHVAKPVEKRERDPRVAAHPLPPEAVTPAIWLLR